MLLPGPDCILFPGPDCMLLPGPDWLLLGPDWVLLPPGPLGPLEPPGIGYNLLEGGGVVGGQLIVAPETVQLERLLT